MGPPDARLDRTGAPESARGVPPALGGRRADQNRQGPLGRHHHRADVAQHRLCRARRLRALAPGSGAAAPAAAAWSSVPGTAAEHPGPGAARGVDRDRGAGPGRPRGLRGGAGADGREPPTPSGTPTSPRLAAAGARGLPAVRLRLLRAKMARGRVGGRQPADYGHHRCTGTDAHRFAGQAVCDNKSCASCRLERAVWDEIRAVLADPERVAAEHRRRLAEVQESPGDAEGADLDRRIAALRRGIGRLIDGYGLGAERARRVRAPRRGDEAAPIPHRGGAAEAARGRRSREGPDAARRPPERLRREGPPRPGRLGLERHPRGHPGDGPAGRGRRGPRQRRLPRAAPIAARERWPPPRSNPATRPWSARLSRPSSSDWSVRSCSRPATSGPSRAATCPWRPWPASCRLIPSACPPRRPDQPGPSRGPALLHHPAGHYPHQPLHGTAGDRDALAAELAPDLARAVRARSSRRAPARSQSAARRRAGRGRTPGPDRAARRRARDTSTGRSPAAGRSARPRRTRGDRR